jgi:hypothetical protein
VSTARALASFVTCATDERFRTDHLKLCVLWYDEVIFENLGAFDQGRFLEGLVGEEKHARSTIKALSDLVLPLDKRTSPDVIEHVRKTAPPGYPRWGDKYQNYTYPDPENAEEYAHNQLLAQIASEYGVEQFTGLDVEQAEGRARVAVDAVRLWDHVNHEFPCMLQANPDEKLAMTSAQRFAAQAEQAPTPVRLFELAIPSLSSVPWHRIIEFRRNHSLGTLRLTIAKAVERAGESVDDAKQAFDEVEKGVMNDIVESARPKVKKVAVEALLANIPGLPVNPASVYFGLRDSVSVAKRDKNLGWLYLLRDIRAAAMEA